IKLFLSKSSLLPQPLHPSKFRSLPLSQLPTSRIARTHPQSTLIIHIHVFRTISAYSRVIFRTYDPFALSASLLPPTNNTFPFQGDQPVVFLLLDPLLLRLPLHKSDLCLNLRQNILAVLFPQRKRLGHTRDVPWRDITPG